MTKIIHYPKGLNPYKNLKNQRIPYLPKVDEDVVVGAEIKGCDNGDDIFLILNNNTDKKIMPSNIEKTKDSTYLSFGLGSFTNGESVSYRIYSSDEKSEEFEFSIHEWEPVKMCSYIVDERKITINSDIIQKDIFLYCIDDKLLISQKLFEGDKIEQFEDKYLFGDSLKLSIKEKPFSITVYREDVMIVEDMTFSVMKAADQEKFLIEYEAENRGIFGLGERFDKVNQSGRTPKNIVHEEFTRQDDITYIPIPIFYSAEKFGVFIDTFYNIDYSFEENKTSIALDGFDDIYIIEGEVSKTIKEYTNLTGMCKLPPKWSFGPWISANRWNRQEHIDEQIELIKKYNYPTSVIVIEAWSDEATFYIFNDAKYNPKQGVFKSEDFTYAQESKWPDPKGMVDKLHNMDIKLVLWQIPALKKLEEGRTNAQHEIDCYEAVNEGYVIRNADGSPYVIPEFWFKGSFVPDFSNPKAVDWWMAKRKYLLDMGVDGFKTDGGEFIYFDDIIFFDGKTGLEHKNKYLYDYEKAYGEAISDDQVLFSRAGYTGVQKFPIHWAGDQQSLFSEYRAHIKSGLSLGLSGVPFWSYDIAGFAGEMPNSELYKRSTAMSVFVPIMQWHSEPSAGQFKDILKGSDGINDRSPWNIARYNDDESVISISCYYANMRMNLLPYIYQVAKDSAENSKPMMRHLIFDNPDDANVLDVEDEFMMGDLLVAPIVHEGETARRVYLPKGEWMNIFTGEEYSGGEEITTTAAVDEIPVYIKSGAGIAINLDDSFNLGSFVGNRIDEYKNLCVFISGENGEYSFSDEEIADFNVKWSKEDIVCENSGEQEFYIISKNRFKNIAPIRTISFCGYSAYLHKPNV